MELKPSHEMFCRAVVANGGRLNQAYKFVYKRANANSARHGGSYLFRKVEIRNRICELLSQNGLGFQECIRKLNALTEAAKPLHYWQGKITWQPDNYVRLQAIQTALKMHFLIGDTNSDGQANDKVDFVEGKDR